MEFHSAQTKIIDLLTCKSETITLLRRLGNLLEECLPEASIWIVRSEDQEGATNVLYNSLRYKPGQADLSILCPDPTRIDALLERIGRDALIANTLQHPLASEILSVFNLQGDYSLLSIRVRPSNSHDWGVVCALLPISNYTQEKQSEQLADAELWIKFAVTIAERRLLEERLRTISTRLDLATKVGGIGIFDWEIPTNSIFWTPQEFEIYGLSPKNFKPVFETWSQRVLPEDLLQIQALLGETFRLKGRYFSCSFRFHHTSGEIRWVRTLAEVIYDERGEPLHLIGTEQDITEQLRTQQQLASDRRRLELALEAGELGFWDWDLATGTVQFGGEWLQMLGYELSELETNINAWEELIHPNELATVRSALEDHLSGHSPTFETEHRLRRKNGSWVWVLDRGRVIERDRQGKALRVIGIHANISVQRENRERLREADRRKDEFLATLSHELRNPLAPIRTGLEIIKRDPSSSAASQSLRIMERQLCHMVRLIDDLLDVSRITLGRLTLKREDVSIHSIIEMAVESSRPTIDAGRHTLNISLPSEEVILNCDPSRLAQTVSNLLTNSAKYTPDGGSISLEVKVVGAALEIRVTDNGMGIPSELQEKVFEIFGQVNRTLHRAQGGLGIGLALVRNLVALHGGTVSVSSEGVGKGSTFTISLPQSLLRHVANQPPGALASTETQHHGKVLIVDDNVDAAESLSTLARLWGHTTEVAFSGPEAIMKAASLHPDVVFLDIGLPGMSGLEVVKAIKAADPSAYVVAVTGWGSEETKRKAREAGFDQHLTKPVEVSQFESILAGR